MSGGVYGVDRGVWDHPLFRERKAFSRREAWLWLLSEAAWKPRRVRMTGVTMTLARGQIAHSLRFMATAWGWEKTKVERFFEALKTETMIATDTATGHTITTICNYDKYQAVGLPDATADATPEATAPRQHRDSTATNKKKEINKEGKDDGGNRPTAFELAAELATICGHPDPKNWLPGWCGSPHWVQKCLNEGWLPEVMRAETEAIAKRKRDGPIENYIYLEKPLARAHARHSAPLPKVEITQETINGTARASSGGSELGRIARRLREEGGSPAPGGPPYRLLSNG